MEGFVMIARAHRPALSLDRSLALTLVIGAHAAGIYLIWVQDLIRPLAAEPPPLSLQASIPRDDPARPQSQQLPQTSTVALQRRFDTPLALPAPTFEPEVVEPRDTVPVGGIDLSPGGDVTPRPTATSSPLTWTARRATREFYPAASVRLGEEGATVVRVCVSGQGTLLGAPRVVAPSGHARLDAAAVAWAGTALVFRPATTNGAAVDACKAFRVNFTLTQ
jgi:TonB family protein